VTTLYPTSFASIRAWATEHSISLTEARVRFAQYAVLRAVTDSRVLSSVLVFKGGNALDFIWQPNRSTQDLDFSADLSAPGASLDAPRLQGLLQGSLATVERLLGLTLRVHSVRQQPPGPDKTFVTYQVRIGYALPDEDKLRALMAAGRPSSQIIPMEVSLNEPICADANVNLSGTHALRVSTIEDIVAEKLRALLQQPIRNRGRRQDLLDITVIVRSGQPLDLDRVAEFLLRKAAARNVPVSRAAFHNPEILERAARDYPELRSTTRVLFIPFDEAREALYGLIEALAIPAAP